MATASRPVRIGLALAALYVIWGTTYLAIKVAVAPGAFPPLAMAAIRFLAPAAVLLAWTRRTAPRPTAAAWRRAWIVGALLLTVANGTVTLAETRMPSGVAALLVATVPLWIAGLAWGMHGNRPPWQLVAAFALGMAGVGVLTQERGGWSGGVDLWLVGLVMAGSCGWALGSLLSRRGRGPSFWQDLGMQMAAGGALLAVASLLRGEWTAFAPRAVPPVAWLAVAYLSVFGSVIALGCYAWLLRTTSPVLATTYAFVNPAVAVLAGALVLGEPLSRWTVAATALVVAAVATVVWGEAVQRRRGPDASSQGKQA